MGSQQANYTTMKIFQTLAALALVASVSALDPFCRCGIFVSTPSFELMVEELPQLPLDSCDDVDMCKQSCIDEVGKMTNDLDIWSLAEDGETVGQHICQSAWHYAFMPFIHNSLVHAYFEVCGGPFEFTGLDSESKLCCNFGVHEHCIQKDE